MIRKRIIFVLFTTYYGLIMRCKDKINEDRRKIELTEKLINEYVFWSVNPSDEVISMIFGELPLLTYHGLNYFRFIA